jgi:ketosteroid isomerase-like protein
MTAAERLRDAYRRFATGEAAAMAGLLADGAVYHLPGRHLGGGTLVGRDTILRRTVEAARWCDAPAAIELLDVTGAGSLVTSLERLRAQRRDARLDQIVAVVWRFAEDRCVELWAHSADQAACDVFWREFSPT